MERSYIKEKMRICFLHTILWFASDHNTNAHSGYNLYYKDYYMHYDWIRKFSIEFPNLEICIKLKKILKDKKTVDFFADIKNVKIIVDSTQKFSDTYFIADKAKALCTWSSTLGLNLSVVVKSAIFLIQI